FGDPLAQELRLGQCQNQDQQNDRVAHVSEPLDGKAGQVGCSTRRPLGGAFLQESSAKKLFSAHRQLPEKDNGRQRQKQVQEPAVLKPYSYCIQHQVSSVKSVKPF